MGSSLDGLEVFVAICDAGSIAGAGRALGTPRATLSRQLARLERDLNVRLLHRSTRRLVRTEAGEELYVRASRVVDAARAAREAVSSLGGAPRGLLRVSVPPDLGPEFTTIFFGFARRFPEVRIELEAASRHVDLVGEGFDIALRAGRVVDPDVVVRRLMRVDVQLYASRAYLRSRGRPTRAEDLGAHDCIVGMAQGRTPNTRWPLLDGGSVPVTGRLAVNTMGLRVDAVRSDLGIALLAPVGFGGVDPAMEAVLPDVVGSTSDLALVVVERALMLPRVRAFLDHVVDAFNDRVPWVREDPRPRP